jgi:hypothetical protein|tara:strand:- start:36 stop:248 length:213 start_codon:yes stop_codon:yes gene_type:complete
MTRYHKVNNIKVPFTAEEEAARDAEEAQAVIDKQARIDAAAQQANDKESGKQKLKDLGLNDDEIKALTGK